MACICYFFIFYACGLLVFDLSFLRWSSAHIGVTLTCLFFQVVMHLVFVTHILYLLPLWSSHPCYTRVPNVHVPLSSYWTVTVDPVGRKKVFLYQHLFMSCSEPSMYLSNVGSFPLWSGGSLNIY